MSTKNILVEFEEAVKAYLNQGWRLFWAGPDKRPIGAWKSADNDWGALKRTWRPGYCLAGTPPKDVFVLDVDGKAGKETLAQLEVEIGPLPVTRTHLTQSGGLHLIFKSRNAAQMQFQGRKGLPGLDARAPGKGYVLLPPSAGVRGQYQVLIDAQIAEFPKAWERKLLESTTTPGTRKSANSGTVPRIILDAWTPGQRDALFVGCAGYLRTECVPKDEAANAIAKIMVAAGDEEANARLAKLNRTYQLPIEQVAGFSLIAETLGQNYAKEFCAALRSLLEKPWRGCLACWETNKAGEQVLKRHYTGYTAVKRMFRYGGLGTIGYDRDQDTQQLIWFIWRDETGWVRCQNERELKSHLLKLIDDGYAYGHSPTTNHVREFIAALESGINEGLPLFQRVPDRTGKAIRFKNGTLHLDTMRLEPHSKTDGFIPVVNCDYDENATCPNTQRFIRMLGPNEQYETVFLAIIAQIMFGENPAQKIFHLMGEGGTGKSTFANLCRQLLPPELVVEGRLERINDTHETSAFVGKRLITFSDPDQFISNVEILKKLTGEDTLLANPKYEHPFTFRFTGNVLITSNHAVAPRNHCTGWERRYMLIPCNNRVPDDQRDHNFVRNKLVPEIPGLVNLILTRFQQRIDNAIDVLLHPENVAPTYQSDIRSIKEEVDPLAAWVGAELNLSDDPQAWVSIGARKTNSPSGLEGVSNATADELYPRYYEWCKARGYRPLNVGNFTKAITTMLKGQGWKGERKLARLANNSRGYVLTHLELAINPEDGDDGGNGKRKTTTKTEENANGTTGPVDDSSKTAVATGGEQAMATERKPHLQDNNSEEVPGRGRRTDPPSGGGETLRTKRQGACGSDHVPTGPQETGHRRPSENIVRFDRRKRSDRERQPDQGFGAGNARHRTQGSRHAGLRDVNIDRLLSSRGLKPRGEENGG